MADFPAQLFRMEGDPGAVRASASKWSTFGTAAADASTQITKIDTGQFVGPEGELFRHGLNADMPRHLQITGDAFNKVAGALTTFAGVLESLQDQMRPVAQRAPGLWAAVQAAQGRMDRASTADQAHQRQVANQPPPPAGQPAAPDSYHSDASAASTALGTAQRQWQDCVDQANGLRGQLSTAVQTAVRAIGEAKGTRFKENPKWWDLGGQFTNFVRDHKDALRKLSGALKIVSLVAGVLSFIPVLAPVMGPIAIGTGLLAGAIDLSIYAATGEGNLTGILVDIGLNLLPGVGKLARLGADALKGSRVVTALAGGLGKIRSGVSNLRSAALALGGRVLKIDPIDVVTGEMVMAQTDIELPGLLPLALRRTHLSSYRAGVWFGRSWASTLDQRLEVDAEYVWYAAPDGMLLAFPVPVDEQPVQPVEGPRLELSRIGDRYTISDPRSGRILHFADLFGFEAGEGVTVLPLNAITDRNANRIDIVYGELGAPVEVRHDGYRVRVDTDLGRVVALTLLADEDDPTLPMVRFGYDEAGNLTEVSNSSGQPLRLTYDPEGRITRWVDRNGTHYGYEYDAEGRCVWTRGSDGILDSTLGYDTERRTTTVTDSLGHTTVYHFNDHAQVVREVDPLGNVTSREWDRYDRKTAETDPRGRTTTYGYDAAGNLVEVVRPDQSRMSIEYNADRQPVTVVDYDGTVWRREYDERGNLTAIVDPIGAMHRFGYDERGRLTTMVDPLGARTSIVTDDTGLPLAVTDPTGAMTSYHRDTAGRITVVTDPAGETVRYSYTPEGNLSRRTGPDGATETWSYDGEGNLVEHVDPMGQATRFEIGHFDRPRAQTAPDGGRLELSYDTELRLTAVTNPQGLVWRYAYDPAGRLVQETDFNGRTLGYAYDAAGQLVTRTGADGQIVAYDHDALGAVVRQHAPEGDTVFTYDPLGRLTRASNGDAELVLERDPLGRVLAETCNGRTVESRYDLLGRRTWRRTPAGVESRWEYDVNGQPTILQTGGQTIRFGYDAAGREVERAVDGVATIYQTWTAQHRLAGQTLTAALADPATTPLRQRTFHYRPDGALAALQDQTSGTRDFDLDPVGRVTAVRGAQWRESYAYDSAGNITAASWPGGGDEQGSREYDGTVISRAGSVRYEHDADGRVVLRLHKQRSSPTRTWKYTWSGDDRLVTVTTPDGDRWRYRYDALGRRIAKQRLGRTGEVVEEVLFCWDGLVLAEELGHGGATTWDWQPNTFQPVTQVERRPSTDQAEIDERFYAIVTDLAGAPTELVSTSGAVAWQSRVTVWGTTTTTGDRANCQLRFAGQYHDPETGLHYNFQRYYDPDTGRYHTPDPLGLAPSPNQYAYVTRPTTEIDPLGLMACDPRNLPGIASGAHGIADVTGRWLRGTAGNAGRMPGQIARQLEGQTFKSFGDFREAFWKAVSGDSNLTSQFSASNISRMSNGLAPIAHSSQQVGGQASYILHHVLPIQHGGGVYDMGNLVVVTPRFHLDVLARDFHF